MAHKAVSPTRCCATTGPGADGHVRFTDVSYDCGLAGRDFPTQAAAWADYDNDGDLDLYVGNESTSGFACASQLFRNDRLPDGRIRFTDVAAQAGVENLRMAKGVSWGDYDGDRFPDLYVSNLEGANRLYHNQRDGTFKDVAPELGLVGPKSSFPTWFWDYDNDGLLDIYVSCYFGHVFFEASHYMGERPDRSTVPALYKGIGGGKLVNHTVPAGLADRPVLVMGANFGDLDGDGLLDFYLGTGAPSFRTIQPNLVFANSIEGRFSDVSLESGLGHLQKGHGIAMADLDHDGDLDVFEQMGGAYAGDGFHNALFENSQGSKGWLGVELRGKDSNRFGVGARIEVVPAGEDRSIFRTVSSGASFGANPLRQHIALGESQGIASLSVFWPTTGETQTWDEVPVNRVIRITEGESEFETLGLEPVKLGGE